MEEKKHSKMGFQMFLGAVGIHILYMMVPGLFGDPSVSSFTCSGREPLGLVGVEFNAPLDTV